MPLHVTKADIDAANRAIGQTPRVVARQLIARLEDEHKLPRGSIMSKRRTFAVSRARYDAIVALYKHFNIGERRLSIGIIAEIFDLDESTIWWALKKRGLR